MKGEVEFRDRLARIIRRIQARRVDNTEVLTCYMLALEDRDIYLLESILWTVLPNHLHGSHDILDSLGMQLDIHKVPALLSTTLSMPIERGGDPIKRLGE